MCTYHPENPVNVMKETFKVTPVLIRKVGFIKPTAINVKKY